MSKIKIKTEREINYYIDEKGIATAIIMRKKGSLKTDACPFCGDTHIHGSLKGFRVPHCTYESKNDSVKLRNGITLFRENGYLINEY